MNNKKIKVVIVGAGPGGLTAGLLLSAKGGYQVEIYEKDSRPGGRSQCLEFLGYKFDVGPTFLMMKFILEDVFEAAGYKVEDYLKFTKLDPMYRLYYESDYIDIKYNHSEMKKELARVFPGNEKGLSKFLGKESRRYKYLFACLQKDYSYLHQFLRPQFLKAIPTLGIGRSLYQVLGRYFRNPLARLAFTFQSKYLGMSPWDCPGGFAIIPFVEHEFGIYHVEGGLSRISEVMAELIESNGGKIYYNQKVEQVIFDGQTAKGIRLNGGKEVLADAVVLNADFGYAASHLIPEGIVPLYSKGKVEKKKYSCSTLMFYWGMKKNYKTEHHSVFFASDYKHNVDSIFNGDFSFNDFSFYLRNSSVTDKTVAPKGKSQFYILVPVPNKQLNDNIDWDKEIPKMKKIIIKKLEQKLKIKDLEADIEAEKIINPDNWVEDYNLMFGATFNLSHNLRQMLYFRPHNALNRTKRCYLVGGGTHPGSGLPTIYESGRITVDLIEKEFSI